MRHDSQAGHQCKDYSRISSKKTEPRYRQPNSFGAYVMLLIGLAIAGLIVYYVLSHKEQFASLWHRATHAEAAPAQVQPDQ